MRKSAALKISFYKHNRKYNESYLRGLHFLVSQFSSSIFYEI